MGWVPVSCQACSTWRRQPGRVGMHTWVFAQPCHMPQMTIWQRVVFVCNKTGAEIASCQVFVKVPISRQKPAPAMPESSNFIANLYRRHFGELRAFLLRRVGCHEMAAELTHDTFIRVMSYEPGEPVRNSRALLYRIAGNLAIDHHRANPMRLECIDDFLPPAVRSGMGIRLPGWRTARLLRQQRSG